MVYFQTDYALVYYDEKTPCVVIEWAAYASSEQFHLALEKTFEAYQLYRKKNKKLYWINDCRKMKIVSSEDINWFNKDLNPRLYKRGLRYMAFIMPDSIFATTAVEEYQKNTDPKQITIKNMDTMLKAKRWLKTVGGRQLAVD